MAFIYNLVSGADIAIIHLIWNLLKAKWYSSGCALTT